MSEIIFIYKGKETSMQCDKNNKMKDLFESFTL